LEQPSIFEEMNLNNFGNNYSKLKTSLLPRAAAVLSIIFKVGELCGFSSRLTDGHEVSSVLAKSARDLPSRALRTRRAA